MNKPTLCAVATGSTIDELVQQISLGEQKADSIEVRVDYLKDQKNINLILFKRKISKDIIIACRRKDEGGKWHENESNRLHVIQQAYDLGYSFVDVELRTLEEGQFKIPQNTQTKTIVSFHDFVKTPSLDELKKIDMRMQKFASDVKKIATIVRSKSDIHTLYRMLIEKKEGEKYCIIGMGEMGKQTRIISPLLGGYLTYCSISIEGSAPGQMMCSVMKEIYKLLQ